MTIFLQNDNWPLYVCLNILRILGFFVPRRNSESSNIFYWMYWIFWFSFLVGMYFMVQLGDLIQIWGDLPLMVNSSFLLFTNLALAAKICVVGWRTQAVQNIIDEGDLELRSEDTEEGKKIIAHCHRETTILFCVFATLSGVTVLGWAASAEKNSLPLRAWLCKPSFLTKPSSVVFLRPNKCELSIESLPMVKRYPYDAYKSPAYEITYAHQSIALIITATVNVSMDTMMTTLIALCCCRLKLTGSALKSLCAGMIINQNTLTPTQEEIVNSRLRVCVRRHQGVLRAADEIQGCFSEPILGQFAVSSVIICVTAYQLAVEVQGTSKNVVHIIAMTTYLVVAILQVFLYCYQGNQLLLESEEISYAAFQCPWYCCSVGFRRRLLTVMLRSGSATRLTAGGITSLSLSTFTAIIKASYTFFTVLQQVGDRRV